MTTPRSRVINTRAALERLGEIPSATFGGGPSPLDEMKRLAAALGTGHHLLVKRDDAIPFGFGGNKVRKLRYVVAEALAQGADTVITCGGLQSNHARATAAAAAHEGLHCHLVANATQPDHPTGNALLNRLLGASIEYVTGREDRVPAMTRAAERLKTEGKRPYIIPLGASTPLGALGYVRAISEMLGQIPAPDVIVHAGSSGGTQAGLTAGCLLHGLSTRVIAISADDPPPAVERQVRSILEGVGPLLGLDADLLPTLAAVEVDDRFVGPGYGVPTEASRAAQHLAATTEALFVDHTYTAKALAGMIEYLRDGRIPPHATVLFWHTGGQVGLFA